MKTVLITGASGYLGHHLVKSFVERGDTKIIAIGGRPEDKVNPLLDNPLVQFYTLDRLFIDQFDDIDTVINCAFARSNDATLLAQAFDFTEMLIHRLEDLKVKSVINLSSQGVYKRLPKGELSVETSPIEPVDLYSMAKYASEKLFSVSDIPYVTNIRLASLMMPQRFLFFFVQKAIHGEKYMVTAPNQYAALLDVTDAASGLVAVTTLPHEKRFNVYNLGIGTQYSLLEYANSVKSIGEKFGYTVEYEIADNKIESNAGMDCSKLMKDTGWKPTILKDEMITNLYNEIQ